MGLFLMAAGLLSSGILGWRLVRLRRSRAGQGPPAPPAEPSLNAPGASVRTLSLVGFLLAVLGLIGLALRHHLFATEPIWIAVQTLAVGWMIWARMTFGMRSFHAAANPTPGALVTHGPYRWLRHPIYAAILWFVAAGIAVHPNLTALGLGVLVGAGLAVRMHLEERLLRRTYPEYAAYAARTRRIVPFLI